jgi:hypothetical protein
MKEVNKLIGVADFEYTILQSNKAMKTHRLIGTKDWGPMEAEACDRWCKDLMKKWYPCSVFNPWRASPPDGGNASGNTAEGTQALSLATQPAKPTRLVLTDVCIPGILHGRRRMLID